jgi:hypothetical protein
MRHEKNAVIHFRRNMLDLAGRKTNLPAHDGLDATIESLGPPKFSRQAFWSRISGWQGPLLHRTAAIVHSVPPNSMNICPQAKTFRKD